MLCCNHRLFIPAKILESVNVFPEGPAPLLLFPFCPTVSLPFYTFKLGSPDNTSRK